MKLVDELAEPAIQFVYSWYECCTIGETACIYASDTVCVQSVIQLVHNWWLFG